MTRTFTATRAKRSSLPLLIGITAPSSGGKTFSALRMATGIQRVTGGKIRLIDTESRRALHYADRFDFEHVPFEAPFSPLDYLAALEFCAKDPGPIIVDSTSHEHEGPGGVLEWHEAEVEKLMKAWNTGRNAVQMPAWAAPKAARRRLINSIQQLGVNAIFCFRAKEKIRLPKRGETDREVKDLGWMPIAGEEFVFEMTVQALLYPNSGGVPTWAPELPGERAMVKLPGQFREHFLAKQGKPLDEADGEFMARWAAGDAPKAHLPACDADALDKLMVLIGEQQTNEGLTNVLTSWRGMYAYTDEQRATINKAREAKLAALKGGK